MIEKQLLDILNHANEDEIETLTYEFVNEFRSGGKADHNDILTLLDSKIDIVRNYGCYILCETVIKDIELRKKLIEKLKYILKSDFNNRIRAFDALYGMYLDNEDTDGLFLFCQEMKNDVEETIKKNSRNYLEKFKNKPDRSGFENYHKYLYSWLYND